MNAPRYTFRYDMNAYRSTRASDGRVGGYTLLQHCTDLQAQFDPPRVGEPIWIECEGDYGLANVTELIEGRGVRFLIDMEKWGDAPSSHNFVYSSGDVAGLVTQHTFGNLSRLSISPQRVED